MQTDKLMVGTSKANTPQPIAPVIRTLTALENSIDTAHNELTELVDSLGTVREVEPSKPVDGTERAAGTCPLDESLLQAVARVRGLTERIQLLKSELRV